MRNPINWNTIRAILYSFILLAFGVVWAAPVFQPDEFVTTWQTDNPGTSSSTSITVPMFGGPYEIDWDNDGIFDESGLHGAVTRDFLVAGTYTIRIRGDFDTIIFANGGDKAKIISLDQWGNHAWTSMAGAFHGASNLVVSAIDVPDLSALTTLQWMWADASLANPDTTNWDTSSVTNMHGVFLGATSASPDTSNWDTSAVTTMHEMFRDTSANPNTSGWDTSSVTNMGWMFNRNPVANPDTSNWDTSAVTFMQSMFAKATSANPDTSNWDTSAVTNMTQMFFEAKSANPDTSVWNTSSVEAMDGLFSRATVANPDTSNWDTSSVTNMTSMFADATSANPDTSGWDTSSVTHMGVMFKKATSANPDTSGWDTSSVTYMDAMFEDATSANPDSSNWDTSSVVSMNRMFKGATSANPDTSNWDTSSVANFGFMFAEATFANPDVSNWNTSSASITSHMFNGAISFDRDIGSWTVTALTQADKMFTGVTLSTSNYESLLIGWNAQTLQPGVTFDGGNSTYCSAEAASAKANIVASFSWTVSDGGQVCDEIFTDGFEEQIVAVSISISGDDEYELFVNGVLIGGNNSWAVAETWDVLLTTGRNVIAIKGLNAANGTHPGAFIADISIGENRVVTDSSWVVSTQFVEGWEQVSGSLVGETQAFEYGSIESSIWWNRNDGSGITIESGQFPIDSTAQWIWSEGFQTDAVVYSRKEIVLE